MGAVIWINGPFSAGKTAVAHELLGRLHDAFLLDPEQIGILVRDHLLPPELYPGDFQDVPLWRDFTRDAVLHAATSRAGPVVVPMTLARAGVFDEIVGRLRERVDVRHFTLVASRETVLARERARPDDTGGWSAKTIDRVLPELRHPRYREHLDAEQRRPAELADAIAERVGAAYGARGAS